MDRWYNRLVEKQMTKLLDSLRRCKYDDSPWDHFIIQDVLTDKQIDFWLTFS